MYNINNLVNYLLLETLLSLLEVGGQESGKLELVKTSKEEAKNFALKLCEQYKQDFNEIFSDFDAGYEYAQKLATRYGKTQRKDMPVIDSRQVKEFQARLKSGRIDVVPPYSDLIKKKGDPFPDGLSREEAEHWLEAGLKDGEKEDDITKVYEKRVPAKKLIPIQKQIYVDKSLESIIKNGKDKSMNFLKSSISIASKDLAIIDGHHRWLSACLLDLNLPITLVVIDLDLKDLLKLAGVYGKALGNKPNL